MTVIRYWQGSIRLAGGVGVGAEALLLPQDEATAAVVIAAILARNFGGTWPGWYRAEVDAGDGSEPHVVGEGDPRVRLAYAALDAVPGREFSASELARARERVLAGGAVG